MNAHTTRNRWLWLAPLALAFALLGILLVLLPAQAQGSIRYVATDGSDSGNCSDSGAPCLTIAYAIGQASAGDTIQIAAGAYTENLTVDRALTFAGAGAASTFVDGGGTDRVFTMTAAVAVAGLTIQNGAATDYGGGIRSNSALTLTNVTVYSNTAQLGGGVYVEGATTYAASMVITGAHFLSNTASSGPGGGLMFFGHLTVAESRFDGNHAEWGRGGGIYATGPFTLTGVAFTNNSVAQSGATGGAVYAGPGPATGIIAAMTNITVTRNSAFDGGGGIGLGSFGHVMILGGHFEANRCTANSCSGGALTLSDRPATIAATRFISNEAGYQGGGLYTSGAITITQGLFERNVLRQSGGMGGGMAAGGTSVIAVVSDTHFVSNTAGTGGGVRFFGPAQLIGGAFDDNAGGAVYAARSLAITPTLPYTYTGNFTLESTLSATGDLTFTTGTVTFWNSGATHYLTNSALTTFDRLSVSAQSGTSVLDVGTSPVNVSGVFTNAGVIHRLAPTQTVALDESYIYTDGVGQPTVILTQTDGAPMGDTSVRVSANLATNNFVCNGAALSPQAVRRYFDINSGGDDSNVTADLTLRYYAPANPFFSEANNTTADSMVIYHCDGTRWVALNGSYTRGVEGDYRWVKLSGYTFTSFSPFVLGDPPSTDANLSNLTLNNGTLTPAFGWATVEYTASVANSVSSVRVTPVVSATNKATVAVNNIAVNSGTQSNPIPLIVGANVMTTVVTAQDGVTTKTYTVTVTRAPSSNANLTGLALSAGVLAPPFASATTDYTTTVGFGAASVTVTPAVTDTTATIRVDGVLVASGAASAPLTLTVGSNVITTVVTAEDGVTTRTYTVTVTRAGDASLATLAVSTGDLTPVFISSTLAYTTPAVTKLVAAAQVTAATTYAGDAISIVAAANGGSAAACPGVACPLTVGSNVISVTVTAADATARTYTITLTRLPSSNADLADLVVRYGTLAPPFAPATTVYTTNVPSFAVRGVITPTATDADASIVVSGTVVPSGSPAPELPLNFGDNVITVTVTAEDLTATRLYTVTVMRLAPASPWYVQPDGNDSNLCTAFGADLACRTIGGAMNKAAAGDTLYIGAGGYTESLAITQSLTFIGVNTPTVSGGGTQRVISITAGVDVTLNGLTIAGGYLAGADLATSAGAGIYNAGNLTVTNSILTENQATHFDWGQGGALFVAATGAARVIDSAIVSNTASYGGGIVSRGGAVLVDHTLVASNLVTGYVASSGGGIYMSSGVVTITNASQIVENRAAMGGSEGGGIRSAGGQLLVSDSAILSNTAIKGGGAFISGGIATLDGALVAGNFVTNSTQAMGGGIYLDGVSTAVTMTDSLVAGNRVFGSGSQNNGGGMYVSNGTLWFVDSTLSGNRAYSLGGGLYIGAGASHVITHSVIVSNTANQGAGLATRAAAPVALHNMTIYSNTAINGMGGGVYADPPLTLVGGAIYSNTSNSNGGGVRAGAALTITGVSVYGNRNSLSSYGAGVYAENTANISGSRFEDNRCTGACYGAGLYMYSPTALLTLVDTQFISNVVTALGGGVYATGPVVLTGGEFLGNRANSSPNGSGLFARKVVTITASAPFTYRDGFELLGDLAVSDNLTLTTGIVSFVVDPSAPTTVVTHTLRSTAATSFHQLAVADNAVLDVGSAVVRVTGVFTNAGVITRLAPAQNIALGTPYTFDDGVGQATAILTQTSGAALGATTVSVSAHLTQTAITCAGAPLPVTAVRRFFTITPTSGTDATADLTLAYFAGAQNSEANGVIPPNLAIFRCNNGAWTAPDALYTTGAADAYQWVKMTGASFAGATGFVIGALPARDAALANLILHTATSTPALTPAFAPATADYTTTVAHQTLTVTVTPILSGTTSTVRVNGAAVVSGTASAPITLAVGANVITTVVTAQDGVTTQPYTVTVRRASDATLGDLAFDFGPLTPAFVSTTLAYTAQVSGGVTSVVITPTASQPGDGVGVIAAANGGAPVACAGSPLTCPLAVGVTVITTTVTAADGTPRAYVVTVTRPSNAQLGALALDPVNVTPVFTGTTFVYTATTGNTTASTLVTATAAFAGDAITITVAANGGAAAACNSAPLRCPLAVGTNVITVTVTAFDGGTTQRYTVAVTRASDGALGALALGGGELHPTFISTTLVYTAQVGNATASTVVTATAAQPGDGMNVVAAANGAAEATCTDAPAVCPLAVGVTVITTTVTAADGTPRSYVVSVTRPSDAHLRELSLGPLAMTPAFTSTTFVYTATAPVGNAASTTLVTPTAAFAGDTVNVVAATGACGGSPVACPLVVGANVITVTVTAFDGGIVNQYTVRITRASDAALGALTVSAGALYPQFATTTLAYTVSAVSHATASTVVTAPAAFASDVVTITAAANGGATATCAGAPASCGLVVGVNVLTATVTAADGSSQHYTITLSRASDTTLSGLSITPGELHPAFLSTTLAYTAAVGNVATGVSVTPTGAAGDVISLAVAANGSAAAPCPAAPGACPLAVGANVITITVTTTDGTQRAYTVTITRAPSSNADLSVLALSAGTLTPAFAPATTGYTATVGNGVASLTVTPAAGEPNATLTANGAPVTSGSASAPIALNVGPNVITTTVTAQDGVTLKHYVVTVTRASQGTLGELALGGGALTPSFDAAIYNYTAAVDARTTSIVVTATVTQPGDSIVVAVAANGGAPVACPESPAACPLAPGVNVVTIVVTAADGTTTTYTVTVTRPAAGVDAINDAASVLQGAVVVIAPLANDRDPVGGGLAVTSVGAPAHGAVVIDPGAQTITYTPDPAITGVDSFTYVARDANGSVDEAMVTVLVTGRSQTDDAPQIGVVDNATGATLTFTDTTFVVEVQAPAGLYTGTLDPRDIFYLVYTVVVTPTGDVHQPPDGLEFGNLLFDMRAFLNAEQLANYHFPSPVTLVIAYDPAQLGNLNEATLTPFYWNGAAWSSDGVTVVARDTTTHTLTLTITHLSEFALFGGQGHWEFFMPFIASASVTLDGVTPVAAPEAPVAAPEATPLVAPEETPVAPPPLITEPTPTAAAPILAPEAETSAPLAEGELAPVTPEAALTEAAMPTQ